MLNLSASGNFSVCFNFSIPVSFWITCLTLFSQSSQIFNMLVCMNRSQEIQFLAGFEFVAQPAPFDIILFTAFPDIAKWVSASISTY